MTEFTSAAMDPRGGRRVVRRASQALLAAFAAMTLTGQAGGACGDPNAGPVDPGPGQNVGCPPPHSFTTEAPPSGRNDQIAIRFRVHPDVDSFSVYRSENEGPYQLITERLGSGYDQNLFVDGGGRRFYPGGRAYDSWLRAGSRYRYRFCIHIAYSTRRTACDKCVEKTQPLSIPYRSQ